MAVEAQSNPEVDRAVALYKQGYTCAQSVLAGFGGRFGLSQDVAFRLGEPFGAGLSCTGGMCGSVTGAIMLMGLLYGGTSSDDNAARSMTYQRVQELIARFKERRGSTCCTDLLGYDLSDPSQLQTVLKMGLFTRFCPELVHEASSILVEMLGEPGTVAP